MAQILSIDDVRGQTAEELLRRVAAGNEATVVVLENDLSVTLQPGASLKPLIVLDGYVPEGWREAM